MSQYNPTSSHESTFGEYPLTRQAEAESLSTKWMQRQSTNKELQVAKATGHARISNCPINVAFGIHLSTSFCGTDQLKCSNRGGDHLVLIRTPPKPYLGTLPGTSDASVYRTCDGVEAAHLICLGGQVSRKIVINFSEVLSEGSIWVSEAAAYCLVRTAKEAHRPTFPNIVEHRKPNLPTMLAACADDNLSSLRHEFMVSISPATLDGFGRTCKTPRVCNSWVLKITPRTSALELGGWVFSGSKTMPSRYAAWSRHCCAWIAHSSVSMTQKSSKGQTLFQSI